ncbi:hypothetical protein JZ751_005975 [Albula glossodonta]|uniref:Uncharacterized protein n=1 Tax=Albula glossodonta TaxID=121402 RepID=A0A8T2PC13_9TELE|nr:hypothetical protein JZ751_005975 [Albula glossodonta]
MSLPSRLRSSVVTCTEKVSVGLELLPVAKELKHLPCMPEVIDHHSVVRSHIEGEQVSVLAAKTGKQQVRGEVTLEAKQTAYQGHQGEPNPTTRM